MNIFNVLICIKMFTNRSFNKKFSLFDLLGFAVYESAVDYDEREIGVHSIQFILHALLIGIQAAD